MADEKDVNSPATTSFAYDSMLPRWDKVNAVLGGTDAMRAAGETYLPRHAGESEARFQDRLQSTTLFNATRWTIESLVGRPFSDSVKRTDVPESLDPLLDDADLCGNNVDVFSRRWFREGMAKAFSFTLVDFPRTAMPAGERTVADDIQEGVRPYWVHIPPESVIFASVRTDGGREVFDHVRVLETVPVRRGFAEGFETRIRVYDLIDAGAPMVVSSEEAATLKDVSASADAEGGNSIVSFSVRKVRVSVYVENPDAKREEDKWSLVESYNMDIDEIPIVPFYASKDGVCQASLPLGDLVDLNIEHWQSSSDQRAILTTARFPILASSGQVDEDKIEIGPNKWLNVADPAGKWYYVEHKGASIEAGRKDLEDIEDQMSMFGATMIRKRPGSELATSRAIDSAESTSPLQDVTTRFEDSLNNALRLSAKWLRMDEETIGHLEIDSSACVVEGDTEGLREVGAARRARDISRGRYLQELMRHGSLADDFDLEANEQELEQEREEAMASSAALLDLDPQQGDGPDPSGDDPDPGPDDDS